jgi:hypothetical protein
MLELSAPERRYLMAACSTSPQYAFRPRAVGRLASFADADTDVIVSSLSRAGMVDTDGNRHARLTEVGRSAARGFATKPDQPVHARNTFRVVGLALLAVVAIAVAGLFLL